MHQFILSLTVLSLVCFNTSYASLKSSLNKIIRPVDKSLRIGVDVIDLDTGKRLYSHNDQSTFIPASNLKLFSDAAALLALGPNYQFKNQLSTDASSLSHGILKGNLYLILPGDPSFSRQDLSLLLNGLKKWGIKKIDGDIIIASQLANLPAYPPGWMIEDQSYGYGAPVSPIIIDENRFMVTVNPAYKANKKAIIDIDDPSQSVKISNHVITKRSRSGCGVDLKMEDNNHLIVRGCVGIGQWSVKQRMAITNPMTYLKSLILKELKERMVSLSGKIKTGSISKKTLLISKQTSLPLIDLIKKTLKKSDNLYAESIFLHTAAALKGTPVSWKQAKSIIKDFLQQQTGIYLKSAIIADGSGLSRYSLITPRQTTSLLRFIYERFPMSYEYISALPLSGRDGTLKRRLKQNSEQDLIRAKTGSMKGIVSLSGYLYTKNGHTLAFSIYINNPPESAINYRINYRQLADRLCALLLKQKPRGKTLAKVLLPHGRLSFQKQLTAADARHHVNKHWRKLEGILKRKLLNLPIHILYRHHEIVIDDATKNPFTVWRVLQNYRSVVPYAVILQSEILPKISSKSIPFLWLEKSSKSGIKRRWILEDAV